MFGCQQVLIHADQDTQAIIEYLCSESNKVFNCTVYYARQMYFKAHRYVTKAELDEELKANKHFQAMHSQAAQQTCHGVFESFKSFKALNKLFQQGKLTEKPRPPKYRKDGLNVVSYVTNQQIQGYQSIVCRARNGGNNGGYFRKIIELNYGTPSPKVLFPQ